MMIKDQVNVVLNRKGHSSIIMVPLQVTCQCMDESESKLASQTHETNVPHNEHWPALLSSWYHYKSFVNIWMKLNLSWMVRFMKQMKLRNKFFYKFGNMFEHGPSHPSTLFAFTHFELVNLGYHDNNQQNQCCLDVAELIMSFLHLNNIWSILLWS